MYFMNGGASYEVARARVDDQLPVGQRDQTAPKHPGILAIVPGHLGRLFAR